MNSLALGIDIGGTQIKAAIVNQQGQILAARRSETPRTLAEFQQVIVALIGELTASHPEIRGAGIGCKGIIDPATTRVDSLPGTLHYLEGHVLETLVRPALPPQARVAADNDARVAMVGEMAWGAARGCRNAVMLTLGTGVGGAVISDGLLLKGATGAAGHIGHYTINPDGPDCICGNRGCLETYFSARAIESEAFAAVHRGVASSLTNLANHQPPSCAEVFSAAAAGDEIAARIVDKATGILAGAIAGLVMIFDPERVILGGQISAAGEPLFEAVRRHVWARTRPLLRRQVPIVPSGVEDPSGVVGAAALVLIRGE